MHKYWSTAHPRWFSKWLTFHSQQGSHRSKKCKWSHMQIAAKVTHAMTHTDDANLNLRSARVSDFYLWPTCSITQQHVVQTLFWVHIAFKLTHFLSWKVLVIISMMNPNKTTHKRSFSKCQRTVLFDWKWQSVPITVASKCASKFLRMFFFFLSMAFDDA